MNQKTSPSLTNSRWLTPLSLLIITFITYFPTRHFPFHFDDLGNITQKFNIRTFDVWRRMLTSRRWFGDWLNALIFQFDGFAPQYYRLSNIAIHLISGGLVFYLISWLCKQMEPESILSRQRHAIAGITTALFLLHPVQTQTISYAIQGKLEGAVSMLILASLVSMLPVLTTQSWLSRLTGLTAGLFFALIACGTKEIVIVAPALLALIDWFFIAKQQWHNFKQRLVWHLIYGNIIGVVMVYYFKPSFFLNVLKLNTALVNNRGNQLTNVVGTAITPLAFLISQFKALLHYLYMFIWPFNISAEYDWKLSTSFFAPDAFLPLLCLLGMCWYSLRSKIRTAAPYLGFGLLWFFATMAPRTSIIPSQELICDYKTYLASIGWLLILAVGIVYILERIYDGYLSTRSTGVVYYSFLYLGCIGLAGSTYQRNQVWASCEDFWHDVVLKAPKKARSHNNYGVELVKTANQLKREGKEEQAQQIYARAIQSYRQAMLLEPNYPDAYSNLSVAYTILNQLDNAIEVASNAIRLFPHYPEAHMNLGTQFLEKKEYAKAEIAFKNAIACRSHYGKAYYNLARAYEEQGEHKKSWQALVDASKADFDRKPECWLALGQASLRLNKYKEAIESLEKYHVIDASPTPQRAYIGATYLANAYQLDKQLNKAAQLYAKLTQQYGDENKHWHNLAECFYSNNQYADALKYFDRAARCANTGIQTHLRIANCYEKMNQFKKATTVLSDIIHADNADRLSTEVLTTCQNEIQRINTASILAERVSV